MAAAILLDTFKNHLNINKAITKDNISFRVITTGSFAVLITCSIIGGLTTYLGDPIVCEKKGDHRIELIEAHCWLHGTRDLDNKLGLKGVKCVEDDGDEDDKPNRNLYYEWVVLKLILSAIFLRIPAWIWSLMEGGLMSTFKREQHKILQQSQVDFKQAVETDATNFKNIKGSWTTRCYCIKFWLCQILAVIMLVGNFFFTNLVLENNFKLYGHNVVNFWKLSEAEKSKVVNPMCQAFPTKVGCKVILGGSSGSEDVTETLCILKHNVINEKIYLVLWFWFFVLFAIIVLQFLLEICFVLWTDVRHLFFMQAIGYKPLSTSMKAYLATCSFGDNFVLHQISKNTNSTVFYDLLEYLSNPSSEQPGTVQPSGEQVGNVEMQP